MSRIVPSWASGSTEMSLFDVYTASLEVQKAFAKLKVAIKQYSECPFDDVYHGYDDWIAELIICDEQFINLCEDVRRVMMEHETPNDRAVREYEYAKSILEYYNTHGVPKYEES